MDKWDESGLIQFIDGRSYAIDGSGKTWDIGSEASVKETLTTGIINPNLCNDGRWEAFEMALKYRQEEGYGEKTESFEPRGAIGSRDVRTFQPRKASVRQHQKKQAPTLRKFNKSV